MVVEGRRIRRSKGGWNGENHAAVNETEDSSSLKIDAKAARTNLWARVIPGNSRWQVDVPYVIISVPFAALSEQDPSDALLSDSVAG